jgi:hypothetical protein
MAVVLKAMPFSAAWRKRQNRIQAIQRLDGALQSPRRRQRHVPVVLRYKPMMSAAFHFKLRIITGHITNYATSAVGAQIAATLDWLTPTSLARR